MIQYVFVLNRGISAIYRNLSRGGGLYFFFLGGLSTRSGPKTHETIDFNDPRKGGGLNPIAPLNTPLMEVISVQNGHNWPQFVPVIGL